MVNFRGIVFFAILLTVIFSFIFLLFTNYISYINRESTKIYYPYILSIKPVIIETNNSLSISLSTINDNYNLENLSLVIVDNNNKINPILITNKTNNLFEKYISFDKYGNHTIMLMDDIKKKLLISTTFNVQPFYLTFLHFIFGQGLGFFIGIIIPLLTILLQQGIKIRDDKIKRLEQKSQWMSSNMKYYMHIATSAKDITKFFEKREKGNDDYVNDDHYVKVFAGLLFDFYSKYLKMNENVGSFYFGSTNEEIFIRDLGEKILTTIRKEIFFSKDLVPFLNFYSTSSYFGSNIPSQYIQDVTDWFKKNNILKDGITKQISKLNYDENNIKKFYADLLLFQWTLNTAIHNIMIITYDNHKKENETYFKEIENYKDEITKSFNNQDSTFKDYNLLKHFKPRYKIKIENFLNKSKIITNVIFHYAILLTLLISLSISNIVLFYYDFEINKMHLLNIVLSIISLLTLIVMMIKLKIDLKSDSES